MPAAIRLAGDLNPAALEMAVNEIIARHEILRTIFPTFDDKAIQLALPGLTLTFPLINLEGLTREDRETWLPRLAAIEAYQPFDLSSGPLLRGILIRFGNFDHVLLICMHHIISDGWSVGVFLRELVSLYEAFRKGRQSPLDEPETQYIDFALWQREWLQGPVLEEQLDYWRRRLSGAPASLELPSGRPRPTSMTSRGARQSVDIPQALTETLKALGRRESASLFMTLLAAFKVLLYRYTQQEDLIVGSPVANRNRTEIEGVIGLFVNSLVLRTDLKGRPGFLELISREREVCLEAYAHQDLPFEKLVDELQPERQLNRNPIFQVMFGLDDNERDNLMKMGGVTASLVELSTRTSKLDLSMSLSENASGGLSGWIEFNSDLFEPCAVERMAAHFQELLLAIAAGPTTRISELRLMPDAEFKQLLEGSNGAGRDWRNDGPLHSLFEAQADRVKDAIALEFEERQVSYGELDARSNQLARYLRNLGAGKEALVGVLAQRSLEAFTGILGVLKAGGAYVPLDPSYPKDRLAFMLDNAGVRVLLTTREMQASLPEREANVVFLDSNWNIIARESKDNLSPEAASGNLAYVLYTSGSTGRPKGVAVEHRQVLNYLKGVSEALELDEPASFALVSTLAADLGNTVIYPALCAGKRLHIISEDRASDADQMRDYFRERSIDCLKIVPSHLASLQSFAHSEQVLPRKRLVLGGEASAQRWVEHLQEINPDCAMFNHYGPTETTVGVLTYRVQPGQTPDGSQVLPLGRPLPNTKVHLLDRNLQAVPTGVPGELCVGGANVTRGYFGSPASTAERFIPNQYAVEPGERLYMTGDRARYSSDLNIEFLGRIDDQVKIRGFRVELREIETVLLDDPDVSEGVVVVREEGAGKRLVAYVVPRPEANATIETIRSRMSRRLPDYMAPSSFVMLESLPLTSNGKVDRRSLPAPAAGSPIEGQARPADLVEDIVANILAEVLGRNRVGVNENFFELGGNSLLATQAVSRLRAAFRMALPLRKLFELPSASGLGGFIRRERTADGGLLAPPITRAAMQGPAPLSYSQWRLWFLDQLVPNNPVYNVSVALRLNGPLNAGALERSINEVVRRHEILRTTFAKVNGDPVQVVAPELRVPLDLTDLATYPEAKRLERALEIAAEEARRPFNLSRGPLLRTGLVRLGEDDNLLLLTIHHIISDDWSVGIFDKEISALYRAYSESKPSPLPDLPVQYSDFARWQREWLTGEVLNAEVAHWKRCLGDNPPALELPTDHPRPAVQRFRGRTIAFDLPASLSEEIKRLGLEQGGTLFMTLLSAFAALLHRLSGQEKIIIGLPVANRNHIETERLIGFFTNILAPLVDMSGRPSYKELMARVRQAALDAYDHQDMPFEKLVEAFPSKRDLGRPALRQVAFAFENGRPETLDLPGVRVTRERAYDETARLDLTLFMREEGDRITGSFEYNSDLFEEPAIRRLIEYLGRLLEEMAHGPERQILTLPPLIDKADRAAPREPVTDAFDPAYERSNLAQSQLLFWFSKKLQPDVQFYFDYVITKFTIEGEIDESHFRAAFGKLVEASDVLRSTIAEEDGAPKRIVHETFPFEFERLDFSNLADPAGAAEQWLALRCQTALDPRNGLFESALLKTASSRWIWFLKLSHIISDLWSVSVLAKRMALYYGLSLEKKLETAPPLPAYRDYITFEHGYRQSNGYRKAEAYWNRKLASTPALCRFYRKDSSETTRTREVSRPLGEALSRRIRDLTSREGYFSPAVVFAAGLFAYQHRISGEPVLRMASPFANRPEGFKETVGLFINVCPLEIRVDDNDTLASLAGKVQLEFIDAARGQMYPVRSPLDARVYNVYFNYQIAVFSDFRGLPVQFELVNSGHSNDALNLQVRDFKGSREFTLDFNFNRAAFDEQQAHQTVDQYLKILECFVEHKDLLLRQVGILSPAEERLVLREFNRTEREYRRNVRLHELIQEQVKHSPDAVAVVYQDQQMSYLELDHRANQLAFFLRRFGVGTDERVGICAERSIEMVVGLLGILKSGGAYLPLDPAYPAERLAFMLSDAQPPVLLTQQRLLNQLPGYAGKIACLDAEWTRISAESTDEPASAGAPESAAYVIYTSGSTGRPKGAMIPHGGICNRLIWMQEEYQLNAGDRVLQKTPFSFDVSVWEFFWPLMTGACLVMAAPGGHQDRAYLIDEIEKRRITTIHFVPSMLQALLEGDGLDRCSTLKRVICSGEALPYELKQRFLRSLGAEIHNLYGPTEASVDVTYWDCKQEVDRQVVPIGRPISNTQIYLLDRHLNAVPAGIPGELHIGGAGLARGYLGRAELTAEKFVPDPFGTKEGARLYKAGDLARYLPGGSIEFLGRIDFQVKIRGFRIELGEIEEAIAQHPSIREAAVLCREDKPGQQRLVAYFVPRAGEPVLDKEMRSFLKERLPEYMIPAAFVPMDEMPLNSNGKLDRKALPRPEQTGGSEHEFAAPRSPLEEILAGVWSELLDVERVGIHDNFFDLGGQSLLATRFITKVQELLPVEIPLRALFEAPTIAQLSEVISRIQAEQSAEDADELARLLSEIEGLSEEDLETLGSQTAGGPGGGQVENAQAE